MTVEEEVGRVYFSGILQGEVLEKRSTIGNGR
jgi:hypothetical protein